MNGKYHVVYPVVEVWEGENKEFGKTIYGFETHFDYPGTPNNTGSYGSSNMILPYSKSNSEIETGLKISEEIYDSGNSSKQKDEFTYYEQETRNCRKIRCMAIYKRDQPAWDWQYLRYYDVVS
jgi:hypothetical protein